MQPEADVAQPRSGDDLGGVLVVHHAERALGSSSSSGSGGGGRAHANDCCCRVVVVLVVKGRQWSQYFWRINNANININKATGLM